MTIDLAHTQAGGMFATATCSTEQLMKDGAPLRATARLKRAKCGKKTRPDMLYANEQREKFKAELVAAGNTGKIPAGLMKEFFREYSESSLGERKEYEDEAKRKADEPEVLDEDDNAMDDVIPTVPGLWGLNDKFNPAAYKYLKKTFLNPVGADEDADYGEEDEQLPAWTAASSSFRSSFVHAGIVTEDTHPGIDETICRSCERNGRTLAIQNVFTAQFTAPITQFDVDHRLSLVSKWKKKDCSSMDLCLRILTPFWLSATQCFPDGTTSPKRRPQIENENSGKVKQSKMKSNSRKEVRTEGSEKKEKPNLCEEIVNQSTELSCNRLAATQCRICLKHLCYIHSNLRNRPMPLCRICERNLWEELQELENMRVDDGSAFQLPVPSSHFEDGFQCSSMPNWLKMGYLLAKCLDFQVGYCRRDANFRCVDCQTLLCSRHVVTIDEAEISVEICRQCLWQRTGRPFVNDDPIEEHKLQLDSDTRDSQRMCEVCHETAVHSCDMCTKPICSDHTAIIVELINETVWHLCYDCWRRGTSI